jgi:catechol 2,3-dioxygenase-like lactoylglutathione lyase family enzyme
MSNPLRGFCFSNTGFRSRDGMARHNRRTDVKLDAIGIVSRDMKESVRFYRLLGLDFPDSDEDHIEAATSTGPRIMLDAEELMKQLYPNWVRPVGQGMMLAFRCKSPRHVDEAFKKVISSGFKAKKEPWDAFWGQRYASVFDPDGNAVDLFAPL